jgi:anti-sigma regulatory factor (Ser/Thr protein kinase)
MRPALSVPLETHPSSATLARSYALDLVAPWASGEFTADTGLLVTELVANAVLHGAAPIHLELFVHRPFVGIEVFDGSSVRPVVRPLGGEMSSGRGLRLVDAIATSWGTRARIDGKVVWCELHETQAGSFR